METDVFGRHCIRTTFEYQLLDELRRGLGISRRALEAPLHEFNYQNSILRCCRLKVRRKYPNGEVMSYPLYLAVNNHENTLEFYSQTKWGTVHNCVYEMVSLDDPDSLCIHNLKLMLESAFLKCSDPDEPPEKNSIYGFIVRSSKVGPYVWTRDMDLERKIRKDIEDEYDYR